MRVSHLLPYWCSWGISESTVCRGCPAGRGMDTLWSVSLTRQRATCPGLWTTIVVVDATETPTPKRRQRRFYSGKKKGIPPVPTCDWNKQAEEFPQPCMTRFQTVPSFWCLTFTPDWEFAGQRVIRDAETAPQQSLHERVKPEGQLAAEDKLTIEL